LGHLTRKIVPEMTYIVLSETLNPSAPYHMLWAGRADRWTDRMQCVLRNAAVLAGGPHNKS